MAFCWLNMEANPESSTRACSTPRWDAPRNHFAYEQAPILRLAAIYAHGLTQSHAFVDGNKRVAFTVAVTFLELNGFRLETSEQDALSAMDDLSAGRLSRDEFESWLKASRQEAKTP